MVLYCGFPFEATPKRVPNQSETTPKEFKRGAQPKKDTHTHTMASLAVVHPGSNVAARDDFDEAVRASEQKLHRRPHISLEMGWVQWKPWGGGGGLGGVVRCCCGLEAMLGGCCCSFVLFFLSAGVR